ncbi:5-Methylthioadenosine/S-adenosylhomocysteine deaminase [Abortiporus biennis]
MTYLLKGGTVVTYDKDKKPRSYKSDILVEGSTIVKIEKDIQPPPDVEIIDVTDKWITPGFVDTHRHTWMTVMRASQADWLLTEYLVKNAWHVQGTITVDELYIGQLTGCLEALHSGVTTILDHFHTAHSPEHCEAALKATVESGARVILCSARQSAPTSITPDLKMEFGLEPDATNWQMAKMKEWATKDGCKLSPDGRVTLGFAYDQVGFGLPIEVNQQILKQVRELGVEIITAHVVGGPHIMLWNEGGLLGPDVVFSHCNVLAHRDEPDDEMWAIMKKHGVGIGSTPEDELGMAHGNPVAFQAVERGVKCGLGIDCTSINSGDIFTQMRIVLQWDRGRRHEKTLLSKVDPPKYNTHTSHEAFRLGTLGGAEAINLSHQIGTIEVGKKADLVVFDTDSANLAGSLDPFQAIVFNASNADVELVMVNGDIVKRDGKLTKVDWKSLAKELKVKAKGIRERFSTEKLDAIWSESYDTSGGPRW